MSDKRKVTTDALDTLGTVIGPDEKRDAIHLAVISAEAAEYLEPGDHVRLKGNKAYKVGVGKGIGIVDPFLQTELYAGQNFWLVIYPRVITSLRHVWTHPEISDEVEVVVAPVFRTADQTDSENWLRDWCSNSELSYEELIELAETGEVARPDAYYSSRFTIDGDYLTSYGSDAHGSISSEVWDHVRNVIGKEPYGRPSHFSCSC